MGRKQRVVVSPSARISWANKNINANKHKKPKPKDTTQGLGKVAGKFSTKVSTVSIWLEHYGYSNTRKGKIAIPNTLAIVEKLYTNGKWVSEVIIPLIEQVGLQIPRNETVKLGRLGDIGELVELTARQVGNKLVDLGYRWWDNFSKTYKPTPKAFKEHLVRNVSKKYPDYMWDIDKTTNILRTNEQQTTG